jgi:photosystem II stability/assembly factor-like uncharacterized protein
MMRGVLVAAVCALIVGLAAAAGAQAAPVSVGHSGWTWGDPTPQGRTLDEVAFDGATGFAVGDFGTVLRSVDAGATWTGMPSGTINSLSVVQEVSPSVVIVGGGCTVRESVDGGASFISLPINPTESSCPTDVASFSFSDQNTGYVELTNGMILFTSDGGQTVAAKTSAPLGGGAATDLDFVTPTTGFAVAGASDSGSGGGVIERTTDSASSWTQVGSAPQGLNSITFVTPTQGFAVGNHDTLLASSNAGATWTALPLALPAGSGPFNLTHISCSTITTCLISTADGKELIRTADGGQTAAIVNPSSKLLDDVAFSTGSTVVGVGDGGATVLSADGGQTFPNVVSTAMSFNANLQAWGMVAGGTAGSAYMPGQSGQIAATNDGGATWSLLRAPTTNDVEDVAFPNTSMGFELESDGTLRTTANGGVAWASLDTGVTGALAVAATTPTNVLLIGPSGIYHSTDGGSSFGAVGGTVAVATKPAKRTIPVSQLRLQTSQTVGGTVLAWGISGLFESTDGGATWKQIPKPMPGRTLNSVSFVSASTGYVLTDSFQRVYFTHNSGRTWTEIDTLGWPSLWSLSFSTAQDGLIAIGNPAAGVPDFANAEFDSVDVLHTANGGKSWQPEVIDGQQGATILATPGYDYYDEAGLNSSTGLTGLFATTDGGVSVSSTTLTIRLKRKQLTANQLAKAGHKVVLRGALTPVTSVGEQVLVSYRSPGGLWHVRLVTVAGNGAFSVRVAAIKSTTDFFAAVVGNGVYSGAGTPATVLTVKP